MKRNGGLRWFGVTGRKDEQEAEVKPAIGGRHEQEGQKAEGECARGEVRRD